MITAFVPFFRTGQIKPLVVTSRERSPLATEVPTVFVSLTQPNHLIDVPMVKTAINAHADTKEAISATIQKIMGRSEFHGTFNDNVFCESFDTRL